MARTQRFGGATSAALPDRAGALAGLARSLPIRDYWRPVSYLVLGALLGLGLLVAAATLPTFAGYHTYVVKGGSMEPSLPKGSVAVAKATSPGALAIGDIVARHDDQSGEAVLHRVVDITTTGDGERLFVTQGDRNGTPDIVPVALAGAGDKVVYSVPYVGYFLNFATSLLGRLLLVVAPIALLGFLVTQDARRWFASSGLIARERLVASTQAIATDDVDRPAPIIERQQAREPVDLVLNFLLRHSGESWRGEQCREHPPIENMATLELLDALRHEADLSLPMQAILQACDELRIARPTGHAIEAPQLRMAA